MTLTEMTDAGMKVPNTPFSSDVNSSIKHTHNSRTHTTQTWSPLYELGVRLYLCPIDSKLTVFPYQEQGNKQKRQAFSFSCGVGCLERHSHSQEKEMRFGIYNATSHLQTCMSQSTIGRPSSLPISVKLGLIISTPRVAVRLKCCKHSWLFWLTFPVCLRYIAGAIALVLFKTPGYVLQLLFNKHQVLSSPHAPTPNFEQLAASNVSFRSLAL